MGNNPTVEDTIQMLTGSPAEVPIPPRGLGHISITHLSLRIEKVSDLDSKRKLEQNNVLLREIIQPR
jgi:hypothetical protein